MRVYHSLDDIPAVFGTSVLTIGNFDGIHRAHQAVIAAVVKRAKEIDATSMAVTFDPHPTRILRPEAAPKLITPLSQKLRLLQQTEVDATLVLPFSRDLSLMKPLDFAEQILAHKLHAREIHEGFNFHFGHKAEGNVERLAQLGKEFDFEVKVYTEMRMRGLPVSSSTVRQLLNKGDVSRARVLLGRPFSIISHPGRGRGYGHKYTVPTVNLERYDELVPANGVYITRSRIGNETFDSVTNVGVRPTFGPDSFAIESHLLNFHEIELTGQSEIELTFLRRLRDEHKFPDVDALRNQIAKDVHRARRYFHLCRLYSASGTQASLLRY
jgi:riboflavin kinase/FMN adenylyltransferase